MVPISERRRAPNFQGSAAPRRDFPHRTGRHEQWLSLSFSLVGSESERKWSPIPEVDWSLGRYIDDVGGHRETRLTYLAVEQYLILFLLGRATAVIWSGFRSVPALSILDDRHTGCVDY